MDDSLPLWLSSQTARSLSDPITFLPQKYSAAISLAARQFAA